MEGFRKRTDTKLIFRKLKQDYVLYIFIGILILWYIIFQYLPMGGLLLAFKDYDPSRGIMGSDFIGASKFYDLMFGNFASQFWRAFRNTFQISIYNLIFGFPFPIILAIFFSEIGNDIYRKIVQTASYLPHFISEVTITGLVIFLVYKSTTSTGVIANMLYVLKLIPKDVKILDSPEYFKPLYIITGLWKESGYSSIVYFAAVMGVSPVMYEALKVDGGSKLQEVRYVTLPSIAPMITVMLIMKIGRMLNVGYERIILLYNTKTYETADVISSFVYRIGVENGNTSLGTASGMFNAILGFVLVIGANFIGRKVSNTSLW